MAITNNPNSIDSSSLALLVSSEATCAFGHDYTVSGYVNPISGMSITFGIPSQIDGSSYALSVSASGGIAVNPNITGNATATLVSASGKLNTPTVINGSSYALKVGAQGTILERSTIAGSASAVFVSMAGSLNQGDFTVPPSYVDDDIPMIAGNKYIVLNLRTKSHVNYVDGNNIAIATTGEHTFSSSKDKNISDVHVHSRSDDKLQVILRSGEEVKRSYDLNYRSQDQSKLQNKKLTPSKGLKATNWQISVVAPLDTDVADIRSISLGVNELKRRV